MQPFTYTGYPARVIFGVSTTADLPCEVERLSIDEKYYRGKITSDANGRYECKSILPIDVTNELGQGSGFSICLPHKVTTHVTDKSGRPVCHEVDA